ncbi:hypothetical protein ACROSR_16535, partial [Roseovarius tibetensis]|uniref:hypothetical protein n=1 Tax=Roseovarius tibetensis TaxID=2685897 RepID=UPI003D7FA037
KEVTVNDAIDGLDLAMTASLAVDCGAGGTVTVSATDLRRHVRLLLTGRPGAGFTVELADVPRLLAVRNATDAAAMVTGTAGVEAIELPPGAELMVHSGPDGVTGVAAAGGGIYDFGAVAFAAPPPGAVIGKVVLPRAIVIPADFAGARGDVDTPPAADWVLDVTRNGLSIGTVTVATDGALAFATVAGAAVPIAPGDVIRFVADPRDTPAETAIAGFAVTIAAEVAQ